MSALLENFLEMLALERGAAQNTIDAYRRDLEALDEFLSPRKLSFKSASERDLTKFIQNLAKEGMSSSTQARRLSAVKQFYSFLLQEEFRSDNPANEHRGAQKRSPSSQIFE